MDADTRIALAVILTILGMLCICVGDARVPVRGGLVLKLFSWATASKPWFKWAIGVALILAGVATGIRI